MVTRKSFLKAFGLAIGAVVTTRSFAKTNQSQVFDPLNSMYNINDFGAIRNNATIDSGIAIQNAINACKLNGGGIVYIPAGQYYIKSTINVFAPNIVISGTGAASQLIVPADSTSTISIFNVGRDPNNINISNPNTVFRDFTINSLKNFAAVANHCVFNCLMIERCEFHNIKITPQEAGNTNFKHAILINKFDNILISRCYIQCHGYGIRANGNSTDMAWGANLFINNGTKIWTNNISGSVGVYLAGNCGGVAIEDTDIVNCETGVLINRSITGTQSNREIFLNQCYIDGCLGNGLVVEDSLLLHINNTWIASSGLGLPISTAAQLTYIKTNNFANNILIGVNASNANVIIDGCRIFNAYGYGVVINAGVVTITACNVHDNARVYGAGIIVHANTNVKSILITNNQIINNRFAVTGTALNSATGLIIWDPAAPNEHAGVISNNFLRANSLTLNGNQTSTRRVYNNNIVLS